MGKGEVVLEKNEVIDDRIVFCVDSESVRYPESLGLEDENLEHQGWLVLMNDPFETRRYFSKHPSVGTAWVLSSDSVEGINLAATLKRDNPGCCVRLISFDSSGSLLSRCRAAHLEPVIGKAAFLKLYETKKTEFRPSAAERSEARIRGGSGRHARFSTKADEMVWDRELRLGADMSFAEAERIMEEERGESREQVPDIEEPSFGNYSSSASAKELSVPLRESFSRVSYRQPQQESKAEKIANAILKKTESGNSAFVLAVVSGGGGSGKSAVSATAAVMAQARGYKTLLLDADLQFGDMKYLMGREQSIDLTDIMAHPERIERVSPEGSLPALIASPKRLEQSELVVSKMAELIDFLKGYYEVIVVNTGAFWLEQHVQILETADRALFLVDQRPSSVRACMHALSLCSRCGVAAQPFSFALNFCSRHSLITAFDVSCAVQGAHVFELKDGGKEVAELLGAGLPLELLHAKNAFCESLEAFLDEDVFSHLRDTHDDVIPFVQKRKGFVLNRKRRRAACL